WLGLSTFTTLGLGSIPGWVTKIPQAVWCGQKKKNKKTQENEKVAQCKWEIKINMTPMGVMGAEAGWGLREQSLGLWIICLTPLFFITKVIQVPLMKTSDCLRVRDGLCSSFSSSIKWEQTFWGAKLLSGHDREDAESQTVPSLEEILKEAEGLNLSIIFDLRRPPGNHTYHDSFVNQTLETVLSSGVPQAMVLWLPDEDRAYVQERAPQMRQIYGHLEGHGTERPQFLNLPYQDLPLLDIKALHHHNVSVNLFVVNKPWLFSLLWCAGVDSVTTNDCQLLQQMRYPVWLIPARTYLIIWIIINCVSILLLLWTFLLQWRCAKERQRTGLETAVLLTRINNFITE
ncbi:hypothetical protein FD755_025110, partial [Muntiacus reevesi]